MLAERALGSRARKRTLLALGERLSLDELRPAQTPLRGADTLPPGELSRDGGDEFERSAAMRRHGPAAEVVTERGFPAARTRRTLAAPPRLARDPPS